MTWGARKLFEVGASQGEVCVTTAVTSETIRDRVRGDGPGGRDTMDMVVLVLGSAGP